MLRVNLPGNDKVKRMILIILVIVVLGILYNTMKNNKRDKNIDNKINTETIIK